MGNGEEVPILKRVTYESINYDLLDSNSLFITNTSGTKQRETASIEKYNTEFNNFYRVSDPYSFLVKIFSDGEQTITGLTMKLNENRKKPSKLILGITAEENDKLIAVTNNAGLINTSVFIEEPIPINETEDYIKFELKIIGENASGELLILTADEEIYVYSLDDLIFFSKSYSDYYEEELFENYFLDLTI